MNLNTAIQEIQSFWQDEPIFHLQHRHQEELARIQQEFTYPLPNELQQYILNFCPQHSFQLMTVGNPIVIYAISQLQYLQDGYNDHSEDQALGWDDDIFMFADEGADPILIRLAQANAPVEKLFHGYGDWRSGEYLADNIAQFMLCATFQHYALGSHNDSIVDDQRGFNLHPDIAKWYFPKMKQYAGKYYTEWCAAFDNA